MVDNHEAVKYGDLEKTVKNLCGGGAQNLSKSSLKRRGVKEQMNERCEEEKELNPGPPRMRMARHLSSHLQRHRR